MACRESTRRHACSTSSERVKSVDQQPLVGLGQVVVELGALVEEIHVDRLGLGLRGDLDVEVEADALVRLDADAERVGLHAPAVAVFGAGGKKDAGRPL